MAFQNPVVFLPGITGTSLHDDYPLRREDLWTPILNKEYRRVSMHPDNPRYEALEPARVVPGRVFGLIYDDLIEALRHDLSARDDERTPVFAFPYDWRQPLGETATQLADFVDEVIERTRLLRHYKGWQRARRQVDLVGHSMGGLVIAEYLHSFGARKAVRRVATLGTPFEGSVEAVVKLITGLGSLSGDKPSEREREAARSTPSIYHLLPGYPGAVTREPGSRDAVDLFRAGAWQPTIVESLCEYVRLHSVRARPDAAHNLRRARRLFGDLLRTAREHREHVRALRLRRGGLRDSDWLVVAGAGEATRTTLATRRVRGEIRFQLPEGGGDDFPHSRETGDGTVPLAGAIPPFLDERRVVVVTPRELGFFELRDRALGGIAGFHALLPNVNAVQRLVIKHLLPAFRGGVGGHPLPGVAPSRWNPPVAGLR